jgi:hypothetical protein
MTVDRAAMLARRAWTSHPVEYPTSGTKPIEPNDWTARVLDGGDVFVRNKLAEIAKVFPDHPLIGQLGCGAVINLPVDLGQGAIASINMLDVENSYPPEVVDLVKSSLWPQARAAFRRLNELD